MKTIYIEEHLGKAIRKTVAPFDPTTNTVWLHSTPYSAHYTILNWNGFERLLKENIKKDPIELEGETITPDYIVVITDKFYKEKSECQNEGDTLLKSIEREFPQTQWHKTDLVSGGYAISTSISDRHIAIRKAAPDRPTKILIPKKIDQEIEDPIETLRTEIIHLQKSDE